VLVFVVVLGWAGWLLGAGVEEEEEEEEEAEEGASLENVAPEIPINPFVDLT
jgi:hypothetical protein